jgi:hypothetical protein
MPTEKNIHFTENPLAAGEPGRYLSVHVRLPDIVKSWRGSLFSFEWLRPDGKIKSAAELKPAEREKRQAVEQLIGSGAAIPMPILGIGMMDNVEIGSGRAELTHPRRCRNRNHARPYSQIQRKRFQTLPR